MENLDENQPTERLGLDENKLNDLNREPDADTEPPEQPNPINISGQNFDENYKEYVKLSIPNYFEMEIGSFILKADQLADLILQSYQFVLEKNGIKKTGTSYLN
jgi:hypothetical protein